MRKLAVLPAALVAALAVAPVAAAQSSSYDVTASTSPAKAGSKTKPVGVGITFSAKAQGTARPSTSSKFSVSFAGIKANPKGFKACSVASINAAQSDAGCSSAARIGSGSVTNIVGNAADPNDVSITCTLNITLYNGGGGEVAIFLKGGAGVPGAACPIGVSQALDGTFRNSRAGVTLAFNIPANLMHPVAGLNQGISSLNATLSKKSVRVKGKKRYLLESSGGCRGGSRAVTLLLTAETGGSSTSKGAARC